MEIKKIIYTGIGVIGLAYLGYNLYASNQLEKQLDVTGKCTEGVVVSAKNSIRRPNATVHYEVNGEVYEVLFNTRLDVDDVVLVKYDSLVPEDVLLVDNCE